MAKSKSMDKPEGLSKSALAFTTNLAAASGESKFVLAMFADIRGFSEFSTSHDAVEVAVYVRTFYTKVVEHFFPEADFYKATGDGLLIVTEFSQHGSEDLAGKLNALVRGALRCVNEFPEICSSDPIVNFSTPSDIGFGIARGPACRLSVRGKPVDYSGATLNLAARLMNLARPRGVVLDSGIDQGLLTAEHQAQFNQTNVYLRGVSERTPREVLIQTAEVSLRDEDKSPIVDAEWETLRISEIVPSTVAAWRRERAAWVDVDLPHAPRTASFVVSAVSELPDQSGAVATWDLRSPAHYQHVEQGGLHKIAINVEGVRGLITAASLRGSREFKIRGRFQRR